MFYSSRRKDDDMKLAKVQVSGCRCEVARLEPIPKGIVGGVVSIEYTDSAWDNLRKTVIFQSAVTKDVLDAGDEVIVPAEVVARAGVQLYMGVYGVDADGAVVIPTIWASLGMVRGAASPSGDSSTDPSLPVWAQIQGMIGDLDELDTAAKSNLVAAVNEAFVSGGGSVSPGVVQKIVDDYLKANPPASGKDGKDGITPTIGSNGNWYIGGTDTGKPSRGAAGVTPNIQIGTVTTLPAGSDATASMGGTAENPLLNLGIPKGDAGQGGGSGGESWELIKAITIPEGAEESSALTISTDEAGQAFSLKKAKIFGYFPKYAGASTVPNFSFFMLNGVASGANTPYCYTSGWVKPFTSMSSTCSTEVDLTLPGIQRELVSRSTDGAKEYFGAARIGAVTSIGGTGMLIYPGCQFWLYGVRA